MLEPTHAQRSALNEIHGTLVLAQFLAVEAWDAFTAYRVASERAVLEAGGQRTHCVHIDQVLAGGEMPYRALTVDGFPSNKAAQHAFDAVATERRVALSDLYALVVRPMAGLPRIAKSLGFLAPILRRLLGTASEKEMSGFAEIANPEKGPVPETVALLKAHDQTTPFFMMNLNKTYPIAQYSDGRTGSGEQAYKRYSIRIVPYLISVRGYPDVFGRTLGGFVGDDNSVLHDAWSDFAMVYYPSRRNFVNMMTNTPIKGAYHRDAGLERAVLMPSSAIPYQREPIG